MCKKNNDSKLQEQKDCLLFLQTPSESLLSTSIGNIIWQRVCYYFKMKDNRKNRKKLQQQFRRNRTVLSSNEIPKKQLNSESTLSKGTLIKMLYHYSKSTALEKF